MTDDIHAERRIHQLEEQLRNARDDALEEAAVKLDLITAEMFGHKSSAAEIVRSMKGTGE
jgi:hypothetical protein